METRFQHTLLDSLRIGVLAVFAASVLVACGGGGGGGGTGGTGLTSAPTVSTGVMAKGSTIVNGVRFEDTAANITIDDTPKTAAALDNGMVVKVLGRVNDDGINGTADRVKALVESRGTPTSVNAGANPQSFVVRGQTVLVDDQTVHSNAGGFGAITTSKLIEVHGLRDDTGRIRATRIEDRATQMGNSTLDEIRGVVANRTATTFTIAGQAINFGAAVIVPTGASFQNGSVVEVYCSVRPCIDGSNVFQASQLKVEDAQDDAFRPANGQRMEVEGLISGFTAGSFLVGTTRVTTTGSTRFEGGIANDLANNVKVEAEGSWNGTSLAASKIEFKRSVVRLQGNVTGPGPNPNQFMLNVAGHSVIVEVDSLTSPGGATVPTPSLNCVQIRGQRKAPASPVVVTAGQIDANCSGGGGAIFRPLIQAPVEVETATSVTLLGFDINISNPSDNKKWVDINDVAFPTLAAFLNAVTPAGNNAAGVSVPGTLVKVIFDDAPNPGGTVKQVELED